MPVEDGMTSIHHRSQLTELKAIATEAEQLGCSLNLEGATASLTKLLRCWLWQALYHHDLSLMQDFGNLLQLARRLRLSIPEDRLQELYIQFLQKRWAPRAAARDRATASVDPSERVVHPEQLDVQPFLKLGVLLAIDMGPWLAWHYAVV
jgi:hypothetical protein